MSVPKKENAICLCGHWRFFDWTYIYCICCIFGDSCLKAKPALIVSRMAVTVVCLGLLLLHNILAFCT